MRYTDFRGEFLRYLYRECLQNPGRAIDFQKVAHDNEIPYEESYLAAIHGDLKRPGYIEGPVSLISNQRPMGWLTGHGLEYIEGLHKDDLPEGPSAWRNFSTVVTDMPQASLVPASDRMVELDHNLPEYLRVQQGIVELQEATRALNDFPGRDRIIASIAAAAALWQAAGLKIIQIKVGVLMAIEDAGQALAETSKAIATALMVDALKSLVKSKTGVDLDNL